LTANALFVLAASLAPAAGAADGAADPGSAARRSGGALADVEKVLRELEREEQSSRKRFDELGQRADMAGKRAVVRGRAYVRKARAGLLPLGDGFAAFAEHAATLERLRRSLEADLVEQRALLVERARIVQRLDEIAKRAAPLRVDREALMQAESALLAAEDRQRAFERAFLSSTPADHTAIYGATGPAEPSALAGGFASMKGRLPFPIAGRSEVKSARRKSADGPGLELRAPLGTSVRSVYPGRVAFADAYADYGTTVILDHGDRHYTVTANLGSIDVRVGDEIAANTRLGTVGDAGKGALLYFEIRVGTNTVDPAEWFGL
jgi:septal ring factor EnvC (AmiA/AmiB activator)